jgi:hypothetical protein
MTRPRIRTVDEAHEEALAADSLRDFFVWWDELTQRDVARLLRAINRASVERDLQGYLERHPEMLIQHLGGGHGRWVVPQVRLGSQHVPDFLIADADSGGRHWTAVELESPRRAMFNRNGDPSRFLWHAIRQIIDWRVWLELNRDYAVRSRDDQGLGLRDITSSVPGLILIGRSGSMSTNRRQFRNALGRQLRIEIHSYDWLVDRATGRVRTLEDSSRRG